MEAFYKEALTFLGWTFANLDDLCNGIKTARYLNEGINVAAYTAIYGHLSVNNRYSDVLMKACLEALHPPYTFPPNYILDNLQKSVLDKLEQSIDNENIFSIFDTYVVLPSVAIDSSSFCSRANIPEDIFGNCNVSHVSCKLNGLMVELYQKWVSRGKTYEDAFNCFQNLFGDHGKTDRQIRYFWERLYTKYKKLGKSGKSKNKFLHDKCDFAGTPLSHTSSWTEDTNINSTSSNNNINNNSNIKNDSCSCVERKASVGSVANLNWSLGSIESISNSDDTINSSKISSNNLIDDKPQNLSVQSELLCLKKQVCTLTSDLKQENTLCSRKDRIIQNLQEKLHLKTKCNLALKTSMRQLEDQYDDMEKSFDQMKKQKQSDKTKNLKRKIQRKDESITEHINNISILNFQLDKSKHLLSTQRETCQNLTEDISDLKNDKKHLQTQVSGYKIKVSASDQNLLEIESALETLQARFSELLSEKEDLESRLQALLSENLESKDGKKYSNDMRKTCINLQTLAQVSAEQVSNVIKIVSKDLFHKDIEQLPTRQTVSSMCDEGQILAKYHVGDVLNQSANFDMHSDGTTRDGNRLVNLSVTPSNNKRKQLSLGFTEIAQEDAQTLVKNDIQVLSEVAEIFSEFNLDKPTEKNQFLVKVLKNMTAMMSDIAANEKLHHKKFKDWAQEFVNENDTSEDKQVTLIFLYCLSHVLLGFHSETLKVLYAIESQHSPLGRDKIPFYNTWVSKEPATIRAIRLAGDTLGPRCDAKSGCRADWLAYCGGEHIKSKITSYRSNRFNCTFEGAESVFHHRQHIVDFLGGGYKVSNGLLRTVCADFQDDIIICYLRALGLMHYHIAGPFWKLSISSENHLTLGNVITELKNRLVKLTADPKPLLDMNMASVLPKFPPKYSDVCDSLFQNFESEQEEVTLKALSELCKGFVTVIERQLLTYLPGGELHNPDDELVQKMKHTKLNNLVCENSFGDIDYTQKQKPNAKTYLHSGIQMLKRNKTMEWLQTKTEKEQTHLWNASRKVKNKYRDNHLRHYKDVTKDRLKYMKERKQKADQSKIDKEQKRESIIRQAQSYGGPFLVNIQDNLIDILGKQRNITQMSKIVKNELDYIKGSLQKPRSNSLLKTSGLSLKIMLNNLLKYHDPEHNMLLEVPIPKIKSPKLGVSKTKPSIKRRRLNESFSESSSSESEFYDSDPEGFSESQENHPPIQINCNLTVDTFVAVAYEDTFYIGEIAKCLPSDHFDIKFLSRKGNNAFTKSSLKKTESIEKQYIFFAPVSIIPISSRQWKVEDMAKVEQCFKLYTEKYFLT